MLVAVSTPLVAAGLTAVLCRLEGCDVRVWDPLDEALALARAVVVVDDLALAAQFGTWAAASGEPVRVRTARVLLLTNDASQVDPASIGCVSACLSIECREQELLGTVQCLLQGAPPARSSPAIGSDIGLHDVPNSEALTPRGRPIGGLAPGVLRKVREHIDRGFAQEIDLSRLACIAGLSTSYFSRAFKQSTGLPPHRYVMMRRLAAAAELIRNTSKPLAVVAIDVGFSDQSHFTRIFTQMAGETPGALRRRSR